jgi:NTP pyrophosphatase (non-canonical NTP hydrolase)
MGMSEELGELNHALLKQEQGIRGTPEEHEEAAKDALADLWIYSLDLCNRRGWDAAKILNMTWDQVVQRNWVKCPVTGLTTTDDIPLPWAERDPLGLHRTEDDRLATEMSADI